MFKKRNDVVAIINRNPSGQFAKKSAKPEAVIFSDSFSPTAVGAGLGQKLGGSNDSVHSENVKRQRLFLNMMRFQMK